MKIKTSKEFSITYISGKTLDLLFEQIKAETEDVIKFNKIENIDYFMIETVEEPYTDSKYAKLVIYYEREETPQELSKREAIEKQNRRWRLQQFEALKKEFGK